MIGIHPFFKEMGKVKIRVETHINAVAVCIEKFLRVWTPFPFSVISVIFSVFGGF